MIGACLRSVVGQPEVAEVVVVDNASEDGTAEMVRAEFPSVRLVVNESNLGFAAASNLAIGLTSAPFVLLLNPDTRVHAGALGTLLQVFGEDDRIAAVAPQLLSPEGAVERSCRGFPEPVALLSEAVGLARLFPRGRLGAYRMRDWDHNSRREVDQPMASALAFRRAALQQVGLFDESFPLYFNDVDLCYRLKRQGWRIVFEPRAKVTHHHGHSTRQVRGRAVLESHRSLIRFYRKHYAGRVCWCLYAAVVGGAWLSMWPRAAVARLAAR